MATSEVGTGTAEPPPGGREPPLLPEGKGERYSKGVPQPKLMTIVTGLMLLVGGLMVILGVWGDVGALLLVAFLIPTALIMHNFWKETDPMNKQMEMVAFNKDIALAGGALALFVLLSNDFAPFTITGSLIDW